MVYFRGLLLVAALISVGALAEVPKSKYKPGPGSHGPVSTPRGSGGSFRATWDGPTVYSSERSLRAAQNGLELLADESPRTQALFEILEAQARMLGGKPRTPQSNLIELAGTARWNRDYSVLKRILTGTAALFCKSAEGSGAKSRAREVLTDVSRSLGLSIAELQAENGYFYERGPSPFPPPPFFSEEEARRNEAAEAGNRLHTKMNEVEIQSLDGVLWDAADTIERECPGRAKAKGEKKSEPPTGEKEAAGSSNDELNALADLLRQINELASDGSGAHGRTQRRPVVVPIDEDLKTALFSGGRWMPPPMPGFNSKVSEQDALPQLPSPLYELFEERTARAD